MFRNMVTSLFKYDRISTTQAKAKELRKWADHIVTLAKRGDLHARRQALSIMREKSVVHKIFHEAGDRFGHASGGYTRIIKTGHRPGDAAPMCVIELISEDKGRKPKKTTPKPKVDIPTPAPVVEKTPAPEQTAAAVESEAPEASADLKEKAEAPAEDDASGETPEK